MVNYFTAKQPKIHNREEAASETRQPHARRMKMDTYLMPITKINSKWIKGLYLRPQTIKLLEVNI